MITLQGTYSTAKLFTDTAEAVTINQIEQLLNQEFTKGSQIRIMPDAHAGMGCTIGTTMTITDKVVPNLVGVDIGCGMETVELLDKRIELEKLDKSIHHHIPAGFKVRKERHHFANDIDLTTLRCAKHVDLGRAGLSIGTLGGGNHFIELGADESGTLFLVVHSGSRNLGKQVCEYYQRKAVELVKGSGKIIDRTLAYLEGTPFDDYLHDMAIVQHYADINRKAIVRELEKRVKLRISAQFSTVHNYIDLEMMILRKGAISAKKGERVLIPLNMRDGSLICLGKGNPDWNFSAPHGAGRIMSRTAAKAQITLTEYEKSMQGIYSTSISRKTIDEAPFAYKPMAEIIANIGETVDIISTVKPLYNFKAAE
ncbi:MAG: RtcB family protein [Lachnospiraceae bacterium]|jgi:RNA-splicing ligase RtcB|nr:RtcB family protein [Lachnospiraceae bacterium]